MGKVKLKKCKKGLHEYESIKGSKKGCPECLKIHSHKMYLLRKQNPDYLQKKKTTQAVYYEKIKNSEESKRRTRGAALKNRYWPHLNYEQALAEYDRMLAEQEYCCKICEVHQDEYKGRFHVDHDHRTNEIRGLLCPVCNRYVIAGIDMRAKAKKVHISLDALLKNIYSYYEYKRNVFAEKK